jgi:prepilin-type N-terminal cleavage/methylation domain-containing protein
MSSRTTRRIRGFTLLEMMVVVSIILILLGIAMPVYSHSMLRAREDNLRQNLDTLNQAIYQYAIDKHKMPKSLSDLVSAHYIDKVPNDITGSTDWVLEQGEDIIMSLDQTDAGGVIGVHSGSNQIASDGTEYAKW